MDLLSIVTPAYNSGKYIEQCILSIKNQTNPHYEHIIVDGGSTDKTLDIIREYEGTYNMRYISEPDNGMYDAICKGFQMAKGDIFAWLNSDDMYQQYTVDVVLKLMGKKSINWITGFPTIYTEEGQIYAACPVMPVPSRFFMKMGYPGKGGCGFQQESTFWRAKLWEEANGNEIKKYKLAGDIILWKMFAKYSDIYVTDFILSGIRKHSGQKSENREEYNKERGPWTFSNIILKILHVPELVSNYKAIHDSKYIIRASEIYKMCTEEKG